MAAHPALKFVSTLLRRRSLLLRDPLTAATPVAALRGGILSNDSSLPASVGRDVSSQISCSSSSFPSPRSAFFAALPALSRYYVTEGRNQTIDEDGRSSHSTSNGGQPTIQASEVEKPGDGAPSVDIAVDSAFKASSPRHDMAMLFTCNVCGVRSAKTMSRASYDTGVVIVRCPGCQNLHLIADRYGWFGEPGSVETFLAEKGLDVRRGSESSYEFGVEDLSGWTPKGSAGK